MTLSSADEVT